MKNKIKLFGIIGVFNTQKKVLSKEKIVMKRKFIVIGVLALLAFMVPEQVHAQRNQRQRLGEGEAKALFERLDKLSAQDRTEVDDALKTIISYMETTRRGTSAQKAVFALLDHNSYFSKMKDLQKLYGFYQTWSRINRSNNDKARDIRSASNLMFDMVDFATGKFAGGAYFRALTAAGRTIIGAAEHRAGVTRHVWIMANRERVMSADGIRTYHYAFDRTYYAFSRAWFASAYNTRNTDGDDRLILMDIHTYIAAMEVLRKAGLLQTESWPVIVD